MIICTIAYLFWLLSRIAKSMLHVSGLILHLKIPIQLMLIRHKTVLNGKIAKVIFGNSITLTPGTITVDILDNYLVIHALDNKSAEDIVNGEMEKRISNIFGTGKS